ncbi:hypothetical protein V496_05843 [Pseudogymnoascus sp. VKM F-4515 (FW-2607)]|nr:hypothetical protein V496_05843 [Pseudogymnoascus sp. VKM F-4515 (FW-2607)]
MAPGLTLHDSPPLSSTTSKLANKVTSQHTTKPAPRPSNAFEDLVDSLTAILGPTSGLTSEGVDVDALTRLMAEYESKEEDWGRYALGDASRGYTRNLVDVGNGKSNLLILVWSPNKGSLIHDHADAHCLMRILSGTLRETRYATPPSPAAAPPTILKETTYSAGQVTYMSDSLGVHKISNPDPERMALEELETLTSCDGVYCNFLGFPATVEQGIDLSSSQHSPMTFRIWYRVSHPPRAIPVPSPRHRDNKIQGALQNVALVQRSRLQTLIFQTKRFLQNVDPAALLETKCLL